MSLLSTPGLLTSGGAGSQSHALLGQSCASFAVPANNDSELSQNKQNFKGDSENNSHLHYLCSRPMAVKVLVH